MTKKTDALRVRITAAEAHAFKQHVEKVGETRSRFLRKLIRETINQAPDLLAEEQTLLLIAIRQLVGIANNLNQLTKAIHVGIVHTTLEETQLQELRRYVKAVQEELAGYIKRTRQRWVK